MEIFSALESTCYNQNPNFRISSLYTIGFIFDEVSEKLINGELIKKFLFAIVFNFDKSFQEVLKIAINCFGKFIPLLQKIFSDKELKKHLMENIYNLFDVEFILDDILLVLNDISKYYSCYLEENDLNKIFELSQKSVKFFYFIKNSSIIRIV